MEGAHLFEPLDELISAAGVSGSEGPVAAVVAAQLAAGDIAADRLERDALGNRWLCFDGRQAGAPSATRVMEGGLGDPPHREGGRPWPPERGAQGRAPSQRILAAHMDEIGLRITSIREDGICRVQAVGGIDPQLWEGTEVQVHTAGGIVPACIAPVSLHVTQRMGLGPTQRLKAEDLYLDLGAGSAQAVAALGVRMLDSVTWIKGLTELSGGLVQGRSLDDRFGCLALVELAKLLHAAPPPVPTVVTWTVQEEVGLRGARALAQRFLNASEVIAVDSFTVGLGPRDNRQFDSVRLGDGPALRAWDATTLLPDGAREAVLAAAAGAGIPLQYGHMPGGNDASVWEASAAAQGGPGARVYGLGIPVQYSHSNVERAHLGDLAALVRLLAGICDSE